MNIFTLIYIDCIPVKYRGPLNKKPSTTQLDRKEVFVHNQSIYSCLGFHEKKRKGTWGNLSSASSDNDTKSS